jgi:hypothetical protein
MVFCGLTIAIYSLNSTMNLTGSTELDLNTTTEGERGCTVDALLYRLITPQLDSR